MRKHWLRGVSPGRIVLAAVLLAVIVLPLPGPGPGTTAQSARLAPRHQSAENWAAGLPGRWALTADGTVPLGGQAYVAAGANLALVGDGLAVSAYRLSDGAPAWRRSLPASAGSKIVSVRAWTGVVTVGVEDADGGARTETVLSARSGKTLGAHPAAPFGGAVAATSKATAIIGTTAVTSYANATGRIRWSRRTAGATWRADGGTLYVARQDQAGGVTGLQVIDLNSGTERIMASPDHRPFPGPLTAAADGAVLFTSASGVTAYSGWTGSELWSAPGAVPEGSDPVAGIIYLTARDGSLTGVQPVTGKAVTSVPGSAATGSAGMYMVRGGVALGLDSGPAGEAWGYSVTGGRVTWTVPGLPWPHYFSDLSGIGGSAVMASGIAAGNAAADTVLITACPSSRERGRAGAPPSGGPGPGATVPVLPAGSPAPRVCAAPELIALSM